MYNVTAIFGNVDSYASINYEKVKLDLVILVRNRCNPLCYINIIIFDSTS